jgi:hypothetical protein
MLKAKIFESQITYKSLGARKPKGLHRIAKNRLLSPIFLQDIQFVWLVSIGNTSKNKFSQI